MILATENYAGTVAGLAGIVSARAAGVCNYHAKLRARARSFKLAT